MPAGLSLDRWWTEHEWHPDDRDTTTTYVPVDFTDPRALHVPYGLDSAERDEWLRHLAGEAWNPDVTDNKYIDMLDPSEPSTPIEPGDTDDGEHQA